MYVGLGASIEDFRRRRMRAAWQEDERRSNPYESEEAKWGDTSPIAVAPAGAPAPFGSTRDEDPADADYTPPPAPPPPPTAGTIVVPQIAPTQAPTTEGPSTSSNTPSSGPGAEDAATASSDPAGSGPVATITVQLRNAGNFNSGANTSLRFSMPGMNGSVCATGAALAQLPAGSRANTHILGEWRLTGRWGVSGSGCTFVAESASEVRSGYVDAGDIAPQETPYTPPPGPAQGGTFCPPGQIPKPDGSGCYEPCPMRSQRYDEDTGQCVDIVCPPGTIVGADGLCVKLAADPVTGTPIGIPVEPEPLPPKIDFYPVPVPQEGPGGVGPGAPIDEPSYEPVFAPDIIKECAPGYTHDAFGNCVLIQVGPEYGEEGDEERGASSGPVTQYDEPDPTLLPAAPGEEVARVDPNDERPGGGGIGPGQIEPPWWWPTDEPESAGPAGGDDFEPGPSTVPTPIGMPALDPGGSDAPGFGIVELAITAGLAWVLNESYKRAR